MNKPSKCKNCQWYGKPYWSIINPCDNCPNDTKLIYEPIKYEDYTIDIEKIIEEKDKEIERLNNIINEFEEYLRDLYHSFDYETDESEILDKVLNELKRIKGEW